MVDQEPKTLNSQEISQLESGHIVNGGFKEGSQRKLENSNPVMKKLQFLQEKMLEMEERLEKIENQTKGPGGAQPKKKFSTDVLFTEKSGQRVLTELGLDIKRGVEDEGGQLDKNDFKRIMNQHNWSASTDRTYRNWMEKIASYFDQFKFEVGEKGGTNKPSRIVQKEDW